MASGADSLTAHRVFCPRMRSPTVQSPPCCITGPETFPTPVSIAPSIPIPRAPNPERREHATITESRTRVELVRMAYGELASGTMASFASAVAFGIMVATGTRTTVPVLLGWIGTMAAVSGYRLWLSYAYRRTDAEGVQNPLWGFQYVLGSSLTGAIWGTSTWLFPTLETTTPLGIAHVLILVGLVSASTRLLLPMRKGSIIYLFAVGGPLAARFFSFGTSDGITLGCWVALFLAYMTATMLRNHRILSDALVLRFEHEALAAALQRENADREFREKELQEARQNAESANRAKGEFLATISHEIRTPMNGVMGMLRIVRESSLTPDQHSYLKTASDSAEALLLLLNEVLDFSKIEAGHLELENLPFQPAAVASGVRSLLQTRARDKGLEFELDVAGDLPAALLGDAGRLRQIIINLVSNAIKFTEKGRIQIRVTCPERSAGRAVIQVTVTDTGIGIDAAAQDRLFKPFIQADNSLGRRFGGTGLGLAISKRLAEAMGGTLRLQSAVNQGSTFTLTLPCLVSDKPTTAPPREAPPALEAPALGARVLVVEDDLVNQQVVELFLKKLRLNPKFAGDGEAAVTLATTEPFDLILMDCHLPGIDGMETTRRIRSKLAGGPPLKIIALTANASGQVRDACLASGMDDFLTKPVRFELLSKMLQHHLQA